MTAIVRPIRDPLTMDQALDLLDPSSRLHALVVSLIGLGTPATAREAAQAERAAVAAEREAASLLRSVEARTPRWHELMQVSEAVSQHGTRLEAASRRLGAVAA